MYFEIAKKRVSRDYFEFHANYDSIVGIIALTLFSIEIFHTLVSTENGNLLFMKDGGVGIFYYLVLAFNINFV